MRQRRAVTRVTAREYRKASKKEKGRILSTLVKQTKLNRVYAGWLLRTWGKKVWFTIDGQPVRLVVGASRKRRVLHRPRLYGSAVAEAVKKIWYLFDFMCGKRLAVVLRTTVDTLIEAGELKVSSAVRQKLSHVQPHPSGGPPGTEYPPALVGVDFQMRQRLLFGMISDEAMRGLIFNVGRGKILMFA